MEKEKIIIDIYSDFVCPFCYIGKKNLNDAIKNLNAENIVKINYKSYELNKEASKINSDLKYNEEDKENEDIKEIIEQGEDVGIKFNFNDIRTGNSNNAHRITKFAETKNKDKEFVNKVMDEYFLNGLNLNDNEKLIEIGEYVGLNKNDLENIINSNKYKDQVDKDKYDAFQYQVKSIPFLLFDNRYGASGKQNVKVFEDAIKQLAEFKNIKIK